MEPKMLPPAPEPEMTEETVRVRLERLSRVVDRVERQIKPLTAALQAGKKWTLTRDGWELLSTAAG